MSVSLCLSLVDRRRCGAMGCCTTAAHPDGIENPAVSSTRSFTFARLRNPTRFERFVTERRRDLRLQFSSTHNYRDCNRFSHKAQFRTFFFLAGALIWIFPAWSRPVPVRLNSRVKVGADALQRACDADDLVRSTGCQTGAQTTIAGPRLDDGSVKGRMRSGGKLAKIESRLRDRYRAERDLH